VWLFPIPKA